MSKSLFCERCDKNTKHKIFDTDGISTKRCMVCGKKSKSRDEMGQSIIIGAGLFHKMNNVLIAAEDFFYSDSAIDPFYDVEKHTEARSRLYGAVIDLSQHPLDDGVCSRCLQVLDCGRELDGRLYCDPPNGSSITCFENEWIGNKANRH